MKKRDDKNLSNWNVSVYLFCDTKLLADFCMHCRGSCISYANNGSNGKPGSKFVYSSSFYIIRSATSVGKALVAILGN